MSDAVHAMIMHCTGKGLKAMAIKGSVVIAFALMIVAPGRSWGLDAYLSPCKDQLHMLQQDPNVRGKIKGWYCPDPNARTMPIPPPSSQTSGGGGIPMGLPTTEQQAMATVMGWMFQGLMNSGPSAAEQQQQALLQQKQAEEKFKAEMLQKQRAAEADQARSLWQRQDAARSQELAKLFGTPKEKSGGMSSLLEKQAALQLRAVAVPVNSASDESLRQGAGVGFDEAGKGLAKVPEVPEPEGKLDPGLIMTKVKDSRARVDKLDRELETTRKKQEKAQKELEQARRELTAKQAEKAPDGQQDDAALLAALEAEEQNIATLSREVEENSAQLKVLEDQRHKAVQELETWNGKLENSPGR